MLTTFDQVREWITDNGLKRWMLFRDYSRKEKILDSNAFPSDVADKIAMTEKYLRLAGGHAYAAGGTTNAASEMDVVAEIRLPDEAVQPTQGIGGGTFNAQTIGQLRDEITRSVRAEIEAERWKERQKEIERREKEFSEKEAAVWGLVVNKLAPVAQQLISGAKQPEYRMTAGLDTEEPVHANPIIVDEPKEEQQQGFVVKPEEKPDAPEEKSPWDDFTEEEGVELGELLARFKRVEPEYLPMIRKVVEMAERGDANYQFARKALL